MCPFTPTGLFPFLLAKMKGLASIKADNEDSGYSLLFTFLYFGFRIPYFVHSACHQKKCSIAWMTASRVGSVVLSANSSKAAPLATVAWRRMVVRPSEYTRSHTAYLTIVSVVGVDEHRVRKTCVRRGRHETVLVDTFAPRDHRSH